MLNDNDFMVVGRLDQNAFAPSKEQNLIGLEYVKKHFLNTLNSTNHELINIYLKNTDNANNIIEQSELSGGRLINKFYDRSIAPCKPIK